MKNNNKKKININLYKENITKIDEKKEPQGVDKVEGGEKSEEQITLSPKEKSEEQIKEEKRKEKIKEEVLKLEKNPSKQNYLFFKMENSYEEREKLFYKNMKLNRKINILGKEELKHFYQKFKEQQKELKEKANTKKIELKKEWRSNSLLLPKYKSPIMNIIKKEENEKIKEKCEEKNIKRKNLEKKFNIEIPLPKISEKLRKENLKQNLNLNSLQGVHRVKYIKDELDKIKKNSTSSASRTGISPNVDLTNYYTRDETDEMFATNDDLDNLTDAMQNIRDKAYENGQNINSVKENTEDIQQDIA
ncbi:hypothetical protein, partial [uncultured Methanobrevibacter sp.]|uniref:hypothetical protein n=1 Tax=uncultured Methanobrevibacter sp. TaxID=253161 RepID=UPI002613D699